MPSLIEKKLRLAVSSIRVINAGVPGDTTADALARLPGYLRTDHHLTHAVIELGTNDFIQGIECETIAANLEEIVKSIRALDRSIQIFLMAMRCFPGFGESEEFNGVFPEVAKRFGLVLLPFPFDDVMGRPELNLTDGIHPNAHGTEIYANNVWKYLSGYILRPEGASGV